MNLNPIRIVILTLIVAGIAGAGFYISIHPPKQHATTAEPATWLPMPKDGMDARQWKIRELLSYIKDSNQTNDTLAVRCGNGVSEVAAEQYSVRIGDPPIAPNNQLWQVDFVLTGDDDVNVAIHVISPYPPPPPQEPEQIESLPAAVHDWSARFKRSRRELQAIHDALADRRLWLEPQEEDALNCRDSTPIIVEACVREQYVARARSCEFQPIEAVSRLWELLHQQFPEPVQHQ